VKSSVNIPTRCLFKMGLLLGQVSDIVLTRLFLGVEIFSVKWESSHSKSVKGVNSRIGVAEPKEALSMLSRGTFSSITWSVEEENGSKVWKSVDADSAGDGSGALDPGGWLAVLMILSGVIVRSKTGISMSAEDCEPFLMYPPSKSISASASASAASSMMLPLRTSAVPGRIGLRTGSFANSVAGFCAMLGGLMSLPH